MRSPSDLEDLYEYWRLALTDKVAAERWHEANKYRLSFWDNMPMVFPGFYRMPYTGHRQPALKGQMIPVAIWIEQDRDDDGNLAGDETVKVKRGVWPAETDQTSEFQEASLMMTWTACRRHPVTKEQYDYAIASYNSPTARYVWSDDRPPTAPVREVNPLNTRFF